MLSISTIAVFERCNLNSQSFIWTTSPPPPPHPRPPHTPACSLYMFYGFFKLCGAVSSWGEGSAGRCRCRTATPSSLDSATISLRRTLASTVNSQRVAFVCVSPTLLAFFIFFRPLHPLTFLLLSSPLPHDSSSTNSCGGKVKAEGQEFLRAAADFQIQ